MSVDERGFLSPEIGDWSQKHRAENKEWFGVAEELSRIGQTVIGRVRVEGENRKALLAALLFTRCLSLFQGSILMAERGMSLEASILVRACFESLFYLAAAQKHDGFEDLLVADDTARRKKQANALLTRPDESVPSDADFEASLKAFLERMAGREAKATSIATVAGLGGLDALYDTFYRSLSNQAAHPSIGALNRYFDRGDGTPVDKFRWGPDVGDVGDVLGQACSAALHFIPMSMHAFGMEVDATFWAVFERYKLARDASGSPGVE